MIYETGVVCSVHASAGAPGMPDDVRRFYGGRAFDAFADTILAPIVKERIAAHGQADFDQAVRADTFFDTPEDLAAF